MDFDVAAYRRAAGRLEKMEHDINPSIAAVLILQLCGEVERLQQHRCLWGNDPSGPHYSDEYLESLDIPPGTRGGSGERVNPPPRPVARLSPLESATGTAARHAVR